MTQRPLSINWDPFLILVFLVTYSVIYLLAMPLFGSNDAPWHIASGAYIIEHWTVPVSDPWSYTAGQTPWYNIAWLWDVIVAAIAAISLDAVFQLSVILYAVLITSLAYCLRYVYSVSREATVVMLFIALLLLLPYVSIRPQVISLFGVLIFATALAKRPPQSLFLILPMVMLVWANMHGGFIAGLVLVGLYALDALIARNRLAFVHYTIVSLLCVLATFITPYGIEMIMAIYGTLGSSITSSIVEWQPFNVSTLLGCTVFFGAFILVAYLTPIRMTRVEFMVLFFWFFMGMFSIRHFAIAMLVSAPFLARSFDRLGHLQPLPQIKGRYVSLKLVLVTIGVMLFLPSSLRERDTIIDENKIPLAAMTYIKEHQLQGRILNSYDYGGYMRYYLPDYSLFIDGRAGTAYPEEVLQDYLLFARLGDGWRRVITQYDVDILLLQNTAAFNRLYRDAPDTEWKLLFKGPLASVYRRNADK